MGNMNLVESKRKKNDEFFTQYSDIDREIGAYLEMVPTLFENKTVLCPCDDPEKSNFVRFFVRNFDSFKMKKLICTSYAGKDRGQNSKGRYFSLSSRDILLNRWDVDSLKWGYLEGNGDFRSAEVNAFRDESDMIITNPPFSLYREFITWVTSSDKQFLVIGNKNSITYKEVFPLIMEGKLWSGYSSWSGGMWFETNNVEDADKVVNGVLMKNVPSVWFTNMEHGNRNRPLHLMSMAENIRMSSHKKVQEFGYQKYDNYDAIEVPYTDAIPSDYEGAMGVPITFLEKYCPEQFEILGMSPDLAKPVVVNGKLKDRPQRFYLNGNRLYDRIVIRWKRG